MLECRTLWHNTFIHKEKLQDLAISSVLLPVMLTRVKYKKLRKYLAQSKPTTQEIVADDHPVTKGFKRYANFCEIN